ncbi:hypothetical protein DRN75_01935 [Nanoarchaeota archaeon]|nr:MAG: hypothetical protein DRN75_01935 [Nanoarchaeota archaeon]
MGENMIGVIVSFVCVVAAMPFYIKYLKSVGMVGINLNDIKKSKFAESGGVIVSMGFVVGLFTYIGIQTFVRKQPVDNVIFAALSSVLIVSMIGLMDDISQIKRKGLKRKGLRRITKAFLPILGALPLVAVNAGVSTMALPLIGTVKLGVLYPLLIIPIGVIGASSAINMLAGLNGVEAGTGAVLLSFYGLYAWLYGNPLASVLAFTFVGALLGFLVYNWYPAKIAPGDSLVYTIGIMAATVAIVGNIEKFAVVAFAPWFLEFVLKARSKFKAENFGIPQKDGTLKPPYKKTYSVLHAVMKLGRLKEWQVSAITILLVASWCSFVFLIL